MPYLVCSDLNAIKNADFSQKHWRHADRRMLYSDITAVLLIFSQVNSKFYICIKHISHQYVQFSK